jgi:hypothetical protein
MIMAVGADSTRARIDALSKPEYDPSTELVVDPCQFAG